MRMKYSNYGTKNETKTNKESMEAENRYKLYFLTI